VRDAVVYPGFGKMSALAELQLKPGDGNRRLHRSPWRGC
jgi:hypothetical protein